MGTFVIAQRTQEYGSKKNGKGQAAELSDVLIFEHKPFQYATIEEAAEECEKRVKRSILQVWCVFELVAESKTEDMPVKTFLVSRDKDFAGSVEP
jgi:hypothetical protein